MSSDEYTGKVAATVIPRTQAEKEYLIALRVDHEKEEWEFPGGKQETGETLLETAEREIEEELKLDIKAVELSKEESWNSGEFDVIPVRATHSYEDADQILELKEEKHGEYKWIDPKNYSAKLGKERKCLEAFNLL